ncbi:colostrum trypsin inhibitor, putative, partial [Ixodes scapularis]
MTQTLKGKIILALLCFCIFISFLKEVGDMRRPPSCFQTPRVTGRCKALMILYSYDQSSRLCKKYIYQGCSANGNNFKTLEDCQRKCE